MVNWRVMSSEVVKPLTYQEHCELALEVRRTKARLVQLHDVLTGVYGPNDRSAFALSRVNEAMTRVAVDVSGRPYLVWRVEIPKPKLGEMDTELFKEWFQAFAQNAGVCLHIENLYAENSHHIVESCFKGTARALRQAIAPDERLEGGVASTKGSLSEKG
jgi:imidazoleglycerol phosphate dehydratase HisB